MNKNRLYKTLERQEGFRRFPYRCTAGRLTGAIGRNLQDNGFRYSEALFMLRNDVDECVADMRQLFDNFNALPDEIQEVVVNMRFQLGPGKFRTFKRMIAAVKAWRFEDAAKEMRDSKWYRDDTPSRAEELAKIMENKGG